jgi:hypothetical protein
MKLVHHFSGSATRHVQYVFDDSGIETMSRLQLEHIFK